MNNNLSLLKIVGGISKTLNIANQMIPIYKQVKPLISKSSQLLSNINLSPKSNDTTKKDTTLNNKTETNISETTIQNITNLPTFFQ